MSGVVREPCPLCQEPIHPMAKKCRFCMEFLPGEWSRKVDSPTEASNSDDENEVNLGAVEPPQESLQSNKEGNESITSNSDTSADSQDTHISVLKKPDDHVICPHCSKLVKKSKYGICTECRTAFNAPKKILDDSGNPAEKTSGEFGNSEFTRKRKDRARTQKTQVEEAGRLSSKPKPSAQIHTPKPLEVKLVEPEQESHIFSAIMWMIFLPILLFFIPIIGHFIGGLVGGRRAGGILNAMLSAVIPSLLWMSVLLLLSTPIASIPFIGMIATAGALMLALSGGAPVFIGAIIGGLLDKHRFAPPSTSATILVLIISVFLGWRIYSQLQDATEMTKKAGKAISSTSSSVLSEVNKLAQGDTSSLRVAAEKSAQIINQTTSSAMETGRRLVENDENLKGAVDTSERIVSDLADKTKSLLSKPSVTKIASRRNDIERPNDVSFGNKREYLNSTNHQSSVIESESFYGNDYQLISGQFTWAEAKADAERRGGHLVTITSENEWLHIKNKIGTNMRGRSWWIGAKQSEGSSEPSGGWHWITSEPWNYSRWRNDEPNNGANGREDVVLIPDYASDSGEWNDATSADSGHYGYIFETELNR